MPALDELKFRMAERDDAQAVAALHADSWQRHYRAAYTDAFLDDEAPGFLLKLWTKRLGAADPRARTILAERVRPAGGDVLVGMAHTVLHHDPTWGALLDNLHVGYGLKRHGLGTRLMSLTARAVLDDQPGSGLYLWVLEQNVNGRAFYDARGGRRADTVVVPAPEGKAARLNGRPRALRYAWPDPSPLL
ncbi:MAG TPA: GNAT family N-acetyltransferase [Trebonia sp.]